MKKGRKNKSKIEKEYNDSDKVPSQKGILKVAFVFSCPGRIEYEKGYVCSGATGKNLDSLLEYCHKKRPDIFKSTDKSEYTISNASDRVHYKALTNDTEATLSEIKLEKNMKRLYDDLKEMEYIFCMGKKACYAVKQIKTSSVVVYLDHLSNAHLNRAYSINTLSLRRDCKKRVEIVGDKVLEQLLDVAANN